jgi:hypothetical protein
VSFARRGAAGVILSALALAVPVGAGAPAAAEPNPGAPAPLGYATYGTPTTVCTPTDRRIGSVSGIAETSAGVFVQDDEHGQLWRIDDRCRPVKQIPLKAAGPLTDTEDLAWTADGSLWVADSGGNREPRTSVALVEVPPTGSPVRYVLAYPDGPHDTETLLISPDRSQVLLVTKSPDGVSQIYAPTEPLRPAARIPLDVVGTIRLATLEGRNLGKAALLVTGGAVSPDGLHVVLRTYNDGWEWDAPRGDLREALRGLPRKVTLPVTKQGEAITYSTNGRSFLVSGEQLSPVYRISIQRPRYAPTTEASAAPVETGANRSAVAGVLIVGVLSCLLLLVGAVVIERRRSRRRGPRPPAAQSPLVTPLRTRR